MTRPPLRRWIGELVRREPEQGAVLGLGDVEAPDAHDRRRTLIRPVAHVELCTMQRAGEERTPQPTLRQLGITVRAVVDHGVELTSDPTDDDAVLAQLGIDPQLAVSEVREITEVGRLFAHGRASVEHPTGAT